MATPLLLENGLVDVGGGEFSRTDVAIENGRIVAQAAPEAERVDCARYLVVPGMVNAHNHSNENWFRGMWDNLPLEPWMLFSYPALAAPAQSPDEIYLRTVLGAIEQLRSGATCVVDFLYELDGFTEETLEAVVRAYRDVGLRALVALGIGDRAYHETVVLDQGLVDRELVERLEREKPPSWDEWEAFVRRAVDRFHRPDEGISICPAPSGPQRCTDAMLQGCAALADELDLPIHIHVLETRMQAVSGQRMYGKTLVEHMDAIGFLGPRVCFAHGIWLTPRDIELVRDRDVSIAHNPVSNMKLGSGIAAVPALLAEGINVALGTDGMSSNDGLDMFASLKQAAL
ncbi:MAG: amidohydrolase family protein, partial [Actinomycetota bacterium]|nr:amidohydrolase family protein [Actinomycetota bacterium]